VADCPRRQAPPDPRPGSALGQTLDTSRQHPLPQHPPCPRRAPLCPILGYRSCPWKSRPVTPTQRSGFSWSKLAHPSPPVCRRSCLGVRPHPCERRYRGLRPGLGIASGELAGQPGVRSGKLSRRTVASRLRAGAGQRPGVQSLQLCGVRTTSVSRGRHKCEAPFPTERGLWRCGDTAEASFRALWSSCGRARNGRPPGAAGVVFNESPASGQTVVPEAVTGRLTPGSVRSVGQQQR
jgi:hypothetical protein